MSKKSNLEKGVAVPVAADPPPPLVAVEEPLRTAYSDGPPDLKFCGRDWKRGVAQPLNAEEWAQMLARNADRYGFALIEEN